MCRVPLYQFGAPAPGSDVTSWELKLLPEGSGLSEASQKKAQAVIDNVRDKSPLVTTLSTLALTDSQHTSAGANTQGRWPCGWLEVRLAPLLDDDDEEPFSATSSSEADSDHDNSNGVRPNRVVPQKQLSMKQVPLSELADLVSEHAVQHTQLALTGLNLPRGLDVWFSVAFLLHAETGRTFHVGHTELKLNADPLCVFQQLVELDLHCLYSLELIVRLHVRGDQHPDRFPQLQPDISIDNPDPAHQPLSIAHAIIQLPALLGDFKSKTLPLIHSQSYQALGKAKVELAFEPVLVPSDSELGPDALQSLVNPNPSAPGTELPADLDLEGEMQIDKFLVLPRLLNCTAHAAGLSVELVFLLDHVQGRVHPIGHTEVSVFTERVKQQPDNSNPGRHSSDSLVLDCVFDKHVLLDLSCLYSTELVAVIRGGTGNSPVAYTVIRLQDVVNEVFRPKNYPLFRLGPQAKDAQGRPVMDSSQFLHLPSLPPPIPDSDSDDTSSSNVSSDSDPQRASSPLGLPVSPIQPVALGIKAKLRKKKKRTRVLSEHSFDSSSSSDSSADDLSDCLSEPPLHPDWVAAGGRAAERWGTTRLELSLFPTVTELKNEVALPVDHSLTQVQSRISNPSSLRHRQQTRNSDPSTRLLHFNSDSDSDEKDSGLNDKKTTGMEFRSPNRLEAGSGNDSDTEHLRLGHVQHVGDNTVWLQDRLPVERIATLLRSQVILSISGHDLTFNLSDSTTPWVSSCYASVLIGNPGPVTKAHKKRKKHQEGQDLSRKELGHTEEAQITDHVVLFSQQLNLSMVQLLAGSGVTLNSTKPEKKKKKQPYNGFDIAKVTSVLHIRIYASEQRRLGTDDTPAYLLASAEIPVSKLWSNLRTGRSRLIGLRSPTEGFAGILKLQLKPQM